MTLFMGAGQRLWSKTKTLPPVFTGPVRAAVGEDCRGRGGGNVVSGSVSGSGSEVGSAATSAGGHAGSGNPPVEMCL